LDYTAVIITSGARFTGCQLELDQVYHIPIRNTPSAGIASHDCTLTEDPVPVFLSFRIVERNRLSNTSKIFLSIDFVSRGCFDMNTVCQYVTGQVPGLSAYVTCESLAPDRANEFDPYKD
jgi:hypothetical protein